MKKLFQILSLILIGSVFAESCVKDGKSEPLYSPYGAVLNPPDTFVYYIPLAYNQLLQGQIQFKADGVWRITKTTGINTNTWLSRPDKTPTFSIVPDDTVALQGNIPYAISASNATAPEGVRIYLQFMKLQKDYQSFEPKY